MEAYLLDWANLLIRWLHLITGVAWIGASFYFVMLDNSLSKPAKSMKTVRAVYRVSCGRCTVAACLPEPEVPCGATGRTTVRAFALVEVGSLFTTWLVGHGAARHHLLVWRQYLPDRSAGNAFDTSWLPLRSASDFLVGGWLIYNTLCGRVKGQRYFASRRLYLFW